MARSIRVGTALTALGLVGMLSACASPDRRVAAAAQGPAKADKSRVGLATRAIAALEKGDFATAVDLAERAVEHAPTSAPFRALLGNAYFAAGRFASAEAAFADSLALEPAQPALVLKMALVQIGQGKTGEAVQLLQSADGALDAADHGLALALAGRAEEAVARLDAAARQVGADARVRQNLALAHALAGDWEAARTVAAQDLAADQLAARLQQWMVMAKPARASDQLAALTGIVPVASDPGQPVRLALRAEPTRLAVAEPVTAPAQPSFAAEAAVHSAETPVAPAPAPLAAASEPAAEPAVTEPLADVSPPPPPPVIAAMPAPAVAIAAAMPAPARAALRPAAARPVRKAASARPSGIVVQLGAFANRANVDGAWARFAARHPALRNYAPATARFDAGGRTVYRLSVSGFASGRAAQAFCAGLKRSGTGCFVRASDGDQLRLALR